MAAPKENLRETLSVSLWFSLSGSLRFSFRPPLLKGYLKGSFKEKPRSLYASRNICEVGSTSQMLRAKYRLP